MGRKDLPQLSDFLNIANTFISAAATNQKVNKDNAEAAFKQKVAAVGDQMMGIIDAGGTLDDLDGLDLGEDIDPAVKRNAMINTIKYGQDRAAYTKEALAAKQEAAEARRKEGLRLVADAEMAFQQGNESAGHQLLDLAYNTTINDGFTVAGRTVGENGRPVIEVSSPDGEITHMADDMDFATKQGILVRRLSSQENYWTEYITADKGRRTYNSDQWKDPEAVKGQDGKAYYRVKQIDPSSGKPTVLIFDHEPGVRSEPVAIEGPGAQAYYDKEAMELMKADADGKRPSLPRLTRQQAEEKLKNYYFTSGAMGAIQGKATNADERYYIAEAKLNELLAKAEEDIKAGAGEGMAPNEAVIRARLHVEQLEQQFFDALAANPGREKEIEAKFKKDFGYIPKKKG